MDRVSFNPFAERELNDAARYYEIKCPGLGSRFLEEAERCLSTIVEYPESAPVLQGDIRRQLMRSFPYGLLYTIKPDFIRVLAVMNLHRRPLYWIGRD